jgi:hypothetical protein
MLLIALESGSIVIGESIDHVLGHIAHRELTEGESTFAPRYALEDGQIVDRFPGKTDEEVVAAREAEEVAATQAAVQAAPITKLAFMDRFTLEELGAIYTAAKSDVMVEVFLDKLRLATEVILSDPSTVAGVQALVAAGLLTQERGDVILSA